MSITSVIKKDLKVYTRHEKTVLLIFIAPILIMTLIGSVFSGGSEEKLKDITLGVGGGSEAGRDIIEELNRSGMFRIIEENTTDPAVIETGVRTGKYSAGIFVPPDESQALKLYIDNSRIQVAPVISTVFITTTEKMSYELTLGFISRLWSDLAQMESELEPLREGVVQINESIAGLNSSTGNVLSSLNEINVSDLNSSVTDMKIKLRQMQEELNITAYEINFTRKEIADLDANVSSIYNDSASLRDELKIVVDNIASTDAALLGLQTDLQQTYDTTCSGPNTPQCISLDNSIAQIRDTRSLLGEKTAPVTSLYHNLENVAQTSTDLHEKLEMTDERLEHMQESINNYTQDISHINESVDDIQFAVLHLEHVMGQSRNVSSQMENLTVEVTESSSDLVNEIDRTRDVLNEIIAKSPSVIAAPIRLDRVAVFKGKSNLDFLMPGIISIVLMFISFLLASITIVQERASKTLVRTLLTPLSLEEFIIAKTIALILIALLQGIIMIIVAFALYDVVIPFTQWGNLFLVILVYSASFIGIGMAVATFAESENTAMLSSLVLSIPMLFLCGIFFPFETMPPLMAKLGGALPITMGIRALDSVLIYQAGPEVLTGHLAPLLGYGFAGLGLAYLLLRREVRD